MLQGHNKQECQVLYPNLMQKHEGDGENARQFNHSKEEESNKVKISAKWFYNQENKWSPTRRRLTNKGYQGEKAIISEKISTENQFQLLTEDIKEHMQNQKDDVTVLDCHHDVDKMGKENKVIITNDWVTKSFNHQQNKSWSAINYQQESERIKANQSVEKHSNKVQIHQQAKEKSDMETLIQKEHQKSVERKIELCFNTLSNSSNDSLNNTLSDTKSIVENEGSN